MDTLDNANATNPFANSNNGDIMQKEEYVMNIGEGFKQNGTEALDFLKATNGKRTSHEFDEDDDLGPETDVDTIDDVLLTTTVLSAKNLMEEIVNNNSSLCEKEKATLETDTDVAEKQSVDEFENIQSFRDETPTPPAELVQDGSGLVDNVAESGEDSEDEWNYIKGDQAEKENIDPSQSDKEVCELTSDLDSESMSQLNPNAAEFVPISPKRTTASPPYEKIMDDIVIAQSPKRGPNNDYDINLPNLQEFETEIKMRPSDVEENAEDDETNNAATLSSQEIMENLLNGKSIEEIEFQPNSTPIKFHFGPNSTGFVASAGFMDQSEVLSTKAVIGDDSNYMEDTQLDTSCNLNESDDMMKDEDPMSMSFYQDKEDAENNPFDLNKVQVLPENIDDFLEKPKEEANSLMDTTISDLPEHNPLEPENPIKSSVLQEVYSDVVEREVLFSPVELQQAVSPVPAESPLPQSQLIIDERESIPEPSVLESHLVTLEPISPVSPACTPELSHEVSPRLQSPTLVIDEREQLSPIMAEDYQRPQSSDLAINEHRLHSPIVDLDEPEEVQPARDIQEPICTAQSPVPDLLHSLTNEQEQKTQSLLENKFEFEEQSSFVDLQSSNLVSEPVVEEMVCGIAQSPKLLSDLPLSPSPQIPKSPSPIPTAQSPVPTAPSPVPAAESPVPIAQSPIPAAQSSVPTAQSPVPTAQSPVPTAQSPIPTAQSFIPTAQSPVLAAQSPVFAAQSPVFAAQSPIHMPQELDSPIDDVTSSVKDSPLPESPTEKPSGDGLLCDVNSDDAFIHHETESVTTDVNSFLERSLVPDIASPLSGDEVQPVGASNEYVEIKSETIAPEFPVEIVTTPSEESKTEELQSDENKILVAAAAATAAAVAVTAAAVPSVTEKKPISKPKTTTAAKKPLLKPSPAATKAPSKPLAAKPPTSKTITKAAPAKPLTAASKVSTIGKTTPKEKMLITSKTAEKKPLLNGDAGKTLLKKAASAPTPPKAAPATKTVPAKVRTAVETKATTRPATAPLPSTTGRLTAKTARPTTVAPKTTTPKSTTSSTPTKTTTAAPKPKTTLSPKPKPLAPDTKKQIKETTNKQLTSTTNKPLSTVGRTTPKSVGSTLTKTTAGKVDDKKPTELVRHAAKPKTTTGIVKKTKTVTNGVATKVTTTTTITERTLIKDVSPVVENNMIDNSQIIETNNIAD